jgi:hypothetical protein
MKTVNYYYRIVIIVFVYLAVSIVKQRKRIIIYIHCNHEIE